jgi:hypothetical protein
MEPPKQVRYSKSMESLETVETLIEGGSDEELEELNKLIGGSQNAPLPHPPFLLLLLPQMNRK